MYLILKMLSCSREQRDHSVFIISGGPTFNKSQCDIELRADKWCKRRAQHSMEKPPHAQLQKNCKILSDNYFEGV